MLIFTVLTGKKLDDGKAFNGKSGGLTLMNCDTIQNFYGKAIRENKNDVTNMVKSVWAILKHYSKEADHSDCPTGTNSWCSFNKDKVTGNKTHVPIKNALRPAVVEKITPLFNRLADHGFMASVQECYTHNPCESFNHLLWSLAPKEQYNSTQETSLAVSLAVCLFNNGYYYTVENVIKRCGFAISDHSKIMWNRMDKERQRQSDYRQRDDVKLRRKSSKRQKCKK